METEGIKPVVKQPPTTASIGEAKKFEVGKDLVLNTQKKINEVTEKNATQQKRISTHEPFDHTTKKTDPTNQPIIKKSNDIAQEFGISKPIIEEATLRGKLKKLQQVLPKMMESYRKKFKKIEGTTITKKNGNENE